MFYKDKPVNPLRLILSTIPLEYIDVDSSMIERFKHLYIIAGIENPSDELVANTLVLLRDNSYLEIDHPDSTYFRIKRKV